jgi:outer membrane protein OmpA-like peptidoglycan-associated protein
MPSDETSSSSQSAEEFDPNKTLFFKRRKKNINFLPLIVISALVLGSGALVTWAVSQSRKKPLEELDLKPSADPYAGKKLLSPSEARDLANPPLRTAAPLPTVEEAASTPLLPSPAANAVAFDESKPVRVALPVNSGAGSSDSMPPSAPEESGPINLDLQDASNARVKEEVLQRIDLMPGVSAANKDKLYASVDHARGMGRVLTIPFEKGASVVKANDIERIKQQVQAPRIKPLIDDPTVVFVVLGYADQKGNDKTNTEISLSRARSVMDALRDKCGFQNVMHSVAMGGSTLFSAQEAEKNRVVEIWAVLP